MAVVVAAAGTFTLVELEAAGDDGDATDVACWSTRVTTPNERDVSDTHCHKRKHKLICVARSFTGKGGWGGRE